MLCRDIWAGPGEPATNYVLVALFCLGESVLSSSVLTETILQQLYCPSKKGKSHVIEVLARLLYRPLLLLQHCTSACPVSCIYFISKTLVMPADRLIEMCLSCRLSAEPILDASHSEGRHQGIDKVQSQQAEVARWPLLTENPRHMAQQCTAAALQDFAQ